MSRKGIVEKTVEQVLSATAREGGGHETVGTKISEALRRTTKKHIGTILGLSTIGTGVRQVELGRAENLEAAARGRIGDRRGIIEIAERAASDVERTEILANAANTTRGEDGALRNELTAKVRSTARKINPANLNDRKRIELAGLVYGIDPQAGLELLQRNATDDGGTVRLETALMRIRTKAGIERLKKEAGEGAATGEADENEKLAQMLEAGACAMASRTVEGLEEATKRIQDPQSRLGLMASWIRLNGQSEGAAEIGLRIVREAIEAKTFVPDGNLYADVAYALGHRSGCAENTLADLIKTQERLWAGQRPKEAAVKLGLRIAKQWICAGRQKEGEEKAAELYWKYVEEENEHTEEGRGTERLECAGVMLSELRSWEGDEARELYRLCKGAIQREVDRIRQHGADQLGALRKTIRELVVGEGSVAYEIVEGMNTRARRQHGCEMIVREICRQGGELPLAARILEEAVEGDTRRRIAQELADELGRRHSKGRQEAEGTRKSVAASISGRHGYIVAKHWLGVLDAEGEGARWKEEIREELEQLEPTEKRSTLLALMARSVEEATEWRNEVGNRLAEGATAAREDRREHGYALILRLAMEVIVGLNRHGAETVERERQVEGALRELQNKERQTEYWAKWAVALDRAGNGDKAREIVGREVLPRLRSERPNVDRTDGARWTIGAALGCTSDLDITKHGVEWEEAVEDEVRWGAFWYAVTGEDPGEQYDGRIESQRDISRARCERVLAYAWESRNDSILWQMIEKLADGLTDREERITNNEAAEIAAEVRTIAKTNLPTPTGIRHCGYQLLVEGEAARIGREGKGTWESLHDRVEAIGNAADEAFVLIKLAERCPKRTRDWAVRKRLMNAALEKLGEIEVEVDEWDRSFFAAANWTRTDREEAKMALHHAMALLTQENKGLPEQKKAIFEMAYRIEPTWMASLGTFVEGEEARLEVRREIERELAELEQKDKKLQDLGRGKEVIVERFEELAERCQEAHTELVRRRLQPATYEAVASVTKSVQGNDTEVAYPVLAWAVRNLWDRVGRREDIVGRLEDAWNGIYTGLHYYQELVRGRELDRVARGWRVDETSQKSIHIREGERLRGVSFVKTWLARAHAEEILIADPYFDGEDMGLIEEIVAARADTRIKVLTGTKGSEKQSSEGLKAAFIHLWRQRSAEAVPRIEVTVVEKEDGGQVLHQRYLITQWEGMELGRGWKSLGHTEAKLTRFDEYELEQVRHNLLRYVNQQAEESGGVGLEYRKVWIR